MRYQQSHNDENLYRVLDGRIVSKTFIIKESFSLYRKKFRHLLQLMALSILLISLVFLANAVPQRVLSHHHLLQYTFFGLSIIIFIIGHLFILLNTIKILHYKNSNVIKATMQIIKKLPMILISFLLSCAVIATIVSIILLSSIFLFNYCTSYNPFLHKLLLSLVIVPFLIILGELLLRLSFFVFIIILEEKYLFQALIKSLAYSKYYVIILIKKLLTMAVLCTTLSFLSFNLLYQFWGWLNIDISHSGKILLSIIGLIIPLQLFTISYYIIYKLYSKDFPKEIKLTHVQKAKLQIAMFLAIAVITVILFFIATK